jgi:hypothetical protein
MGRVLCEPGTCNRGGHFSTVCKLAFEVSSLGAKQQVEGRLSDGGSVSDAAASV